MAAGDPYISCLNNEFSFEDIWRDLIVDDGTGKPCFKICGTVEVGGAAPAQGNPDIDLFTNASGTTAAGLRSMTFAWTGAAEIDGTLFPDDSFSPLSFSDENGLDSMPWSVTEADTGIVGGQTILITSIA